MMMISTFRLCRYLSLHAVIILMSKIIVVRLDHDQDCNNSMFALMQISHCILFIVLYTKSSLNAKYIWLPCKGILNYFCPSLSVQC